MEGKWQGQFIYGENYPEKVIGKAITFEMNLNASGIEFYGNFSDDETRDIFKDNGIVSGFIEGNYIEFDKQYPKAYYSNEDGSIEIIENSNPHLIKYQGELKEKKFEGTWEIHQYYEENDKIFSEILGTGTWSMWK